MGKSHREKRESALRQASNIQIARIAHDAATWYKAFFIQRERFLESEKTMVDCFDHTGDRENAFPFIPEKLFWIETIDHTLSDIKDLNTALLSRGDNRLKSFKEGLLDDEDLISIVRLLRNANEHFVDYLLGVGDAQIREATEGHSLTQQSGTRLHWYFIIEGTEILGNVNCKRMIERMHSFYKDVMHCLESIFLEYYIKTEDTGKEDNKI